MASGQPQKSIEIGKGRHVYTFTNCCREDLSIELGDGTTKIALNATGPADDVRDGLKAFLDYVAGKPVHDTYVNEIDEAENNGVRAVISACKKLNGSSTDAVEMIIMNMGMSQEKAEEKVKMYW